MKLGGTVDTGRTCLLSFRLQERNIKQVRRAIHFMIDILGILGEDRVSPAFPKIPRLEKQSHQF